jgi:hypothetical protein
MFAVMVDTENRIDDGTGRMLSRGVFVRNSEVGAGSFSITTYCFAEVCGNHIMWDVSEILEVKYRHIGDAISRILKSQKDVLEKLMNPTLKDPRRDFDILRNMQIAPLNHKIEVIENVYSHRIEPSVLTQNVLSAAYDTAMQYRDIDGGIPNTPWGLMQGLTRYSQTLKNADDRLDIDKAAGKMLTKFLALAR